jgi:hypothetical protein
MTVSFLDLLFGCWHRNLSFPLSSKPGPHRSSAASLTGTYVVCLDCGREFPYDWNEMKILRDEPHDGAVMAPEAAESFVSE